MAGDGLQIYSFDFNGMQMNVDKNPVGLMPPEFVSVRNMDYSQNGVFKKRKGFSRFPESDSIDAQGSMITAAQPGGVGNGYYAARGNQLYEKVTGDFDSGAWTTFGTTFTAGSSDVSLAYGLSDVETAAVFVAFGASDVIMITGLSTAVKTTISGGSNPFTLGGCVEYFEGRLWVGDTTEGGTSYKNRLRFSNPGDPTTFDTLDFIDLFVPGGGSLANLFAIRYLRDRLYLFNESFVFVLTGDIPADFGHQAVLPVYNLSKRTVVALDDFVIFADLRGVHVFDGFRLQNLIDGRFIEKWKGLSSGNVRDAFATYNYFTDEYIIFASDEIWVFNFRKGAWHTWDFDATALESDTLHSFSPQFFYNEGSESRDSFALGVLSGKLYGYNHGETQDYDSKDVVGEVETGDMIITPSGGIFELSAIDLWVVRNDSAGELKVVLTIDGQAQTEETITITAGSSDTSPTRFPVPLPLLRVGQMLRVKITDDHATVQTEINRVDVWYEIHEGRAA